MSSVAPAPPPPPPPSPPGIKHPASREIDVTSIQRRPRAVVILYGWLGAEYCTLKKYAQIYQDRGCCTVCATAPPLALLSGSRSYLKEIAITSCREASMLIKKGEMSEMGYGPVPLVVHAFSNGGAFLVNEIADIVGGDDAAEDTTDDDIDEDGYGYGYAHAAAGGSSDTDISVRNVPSWFNKSQRNLISSSPASASNTDENAAADIDECSTTTSISASSFETAAQDTSDIRSNKTGTSFMSLESFRTALDYTSNDIPTQQLQSPDQRPKLSSVSSRMDSWRSKRKRPRVKRTDSERKEMTMKKAKRPAYNFEERAYRQDMALVASRLRMGSLVFDSGPCFVTLTSGLQAVRHGAKSPLMRAVSSLALIGGYSLSKLMCSSAGSSLFGNFWGNMMNNTLTKRQAYIYSDADAVCDSGKIDELIRYRTEVMGDDVSVLKYQDSPHVMHMRQHKQEYERFVDKQLDAVAAKVKGDEGELVHALQK